MEKLNLLHNKITITCIGGLWKVIEESKATAKISKITLSRTAYFSKRVLNFAEMLF
jgi:hypothetical protein